MTFLAIVCIIASFFMTPISFRYLRGTKYGVRISHKSEDGNIWATCVLINIGYSIFALISSSVGFIFGVVCQGLVFVIQAIIVIRRIIADEQEIFKCQNSIMQKKVASIIHSRSKRSRVSIQLLFSILIIGIIPTCIIFSINDFLEITMPLSIGISNLVLLPVFIYFFAERSQKPIIYSIESKSKALLFPDESNSAAMSENSIKDEYWKSIKGINNPITEFFGIAYQEKMNQGHLEINFWRALLFLAGYRVNILLNYKKNGSGLEIYKITSFHDEVDCSVFRSLYELVDKGIIMSMTYEDKDIWISSEYINKNLSVEERVQLFPKQEFYEALINAQKQISYFNQANLKWFSSREILNSIMEKYNQGVKSEFGEKAEDIANNYSCLEDVFTSVNNLYSGQIKGMPLLTRFEKYFHQRASKAIVK